MFLRTTSLNASLKTLLDSEIHDDGVETDSLVRDHKSKMAFYKKF